MSIAPFGILEFWSRTLYQKREVNALFICKLPKIKVLERKKGSKFDTTNRRKESNLWNTM
ncbi:MAG: hypothetical protein PUA92_10800, partial [Clostridium sp.]|nr:hypothetical protein [Clostridium sp.]